MYDEDANVLTVFYRDRAVEFNGFTREEAPEFTRQTLFYVKESMTFNVAGVTHVSFLNRFVRSARCAGKRPKHLRDCAQKSIIERRPWLKRECNACTYGDRQGSLGHC